MTVKTLTRRASDVLSDSATDKSGEGTILLLASEVAARLRVTEKALEHWRRRGTGPRFVRLGRNCVRYRMTDIEVFLCKGI